VLAVINSLKLDRPLLAGHSVAGEELSSIGSRVPDKVSGLIYLDAGYSYAFYDSSIGDFGLDLRDVRRKLERLEVGMLPQEARKVIQELLQDSLPAFERDLRTREKELASVPPLPLGAAPPPRPPFQDVAIMAGAQKYTNIPVPILAIFALPHMPPEALRNSPAALVEFHAQEEDSIGKQAKAFESGLPSARVVRIPNADHYVFISNDVDVIRELNRFIKSPR
jgi:pimeloyl-ACP methyl ester carboxylesterase